MTEIITLLALVFVGSYVSNRLRGVKDPAKDAAKLTSILGGAMLVLGAIVYLSLVIR